MDILVTGGIELQGFSSVDVSVPSIRPYHQVIIKGMSVPLKGTIVISDILDASGFSLSSTHPDDKSMIVYFDVVELPGARERWEAKNHSIQSATLLETD